MATSCWEEGPPDYDAIAADPNCLGGSTCMLPDGHDGQHEFTPDSEITISFK